MAGTGMDTDRTTEENTTTAATSCGLQSDEKRYAYAMAACIAAFAVFTTAVTAILYQEFEGETPAQYVEEMNAYLALAPEDERYRIFTRDNRVASGSYHDGTGSWSTTVEGSLFGFYDALGSERIFFSPMEVRGLRQLLGGRYLVRHASWKADGVTTKHVDGSNVVNRLFGRTVKTLEGAYNTYELQELDDALTIGAGYTEYITSSELAASPAGVRALLMLRCIVVNDGEEHTVSEILTHYGGPFDERLYDEEETLIKERQAAGLSLLQKGSRESVAKINMETDGYVSFSIPFTENFTVLVDDTKTETMSSNGLLAFPVSAGEHVIKLRYGNPFLPAGLLCSLAGWILWIYLMAKERKACYNKESLFP